MIQVLIDSVVDVLGALESLSSIAVQPKRMDRLSLPAVLLDVAEIEPAADAGTQALCVDCHLQARLVSSDRDDPQSDWQLVLSIMYALFSYGWPQRHIGNVRFKQAAPDHFSPDFQGHRVWLIEWVQTLRVGSSVWEGERPFVETLIVHYPQCEPEIEPTILSVVEPNPSHE